MEPLSVIVGPGKVQIDRRVFVTLLSLTPASSRPVYAEALNTGAIKIGELKDLAERAVIPYPLLFAQKTKVDRQISHKEKYLSTKVSKNEILYASRGALRFEDIELIVLDLARKQEFLKTHIFPSATNNVIAGSLSKTLSQGVPPEVLASDVRELFGINLAILRKLPKEDVLNHLIKKSEDKGIFVSRSSHNYMPQQLGDDVGFSGICIKDKKFPFIFLNTKDGIEKPRILEPAGRQIFTLLTMLVYIAVGKYIYSSSGRKSANRLEKYIFAVVGEMLIPAKDLDHLSISNIDELRAASNVYKVTPSMLLERMRELGLVSNEVAKALKLELKKALEDAFTPRAKNPALSGYEKYNGQRLSREVVAAFNARQISSVQLNQILFRLSKSRVSVAREYIAKFT